MKGLLVLSLFMFAGALSAETCTLQSYASSWMVTGTPFAVKCPSGTYTGTLISTPAKRFFRRGHMLLKFDQPVMIHPKKEGDEGKIQPGRGRQISSMLIAGGVGIGAKDLTDEIALAGFKSWYMIPISCVTLAFFSNGGDVLLKPGFKLEIEPSRHSAQSAQSENRELGAED
jgi:hypothetical protein